MTYFQIGSLALPSIWLAVVGALFIASLFHKVLTSKKVGDWYWNGFFLYFLTWKLSYIMFNLTMFLDMPLSNIYFNGGIKGHLLALAFLSLYLLFIGGKKHPFIYEESPRLFLLYFSSYEVIIHLLEKSWIDALVHLSVFAGFLFLLNSLKKKERLLSIPLYIVLMLLELLILSIIGTIFSLEALTFIWIGLIVLILPKKMKKEEVKLE
jgi:hypothetical protein